MIETADNRRTFARFSARFPVKFRHSREDFGTEVFLRDASAEGVKFSTKQRLFLHDSVSLEVKLPDGAQPMLLNGRVVWVKEKEHQLWDVGLQFHKVQLMRMRRIFHLTEESE